MKIFRIVLATTGLCLVSGAHANIAAQTQPATQGAPASAAAGRPMVTLQMPALPDPVAVTVNSKATAMHVFDLVEAICNGQAKCKNGMLPALTPFMAKARKAGMVVAYGTREENVGKWLPAVAPQSGDITIVNTGQDRFYNTDLDKELKAKG